MTVKEIIEMKKGTYNLIELYVGDHFHTDACDSYNPEQGNGFCDAGREDTLNSYCLDYEVKDYGVMNCEEYNRTILANCGMKAENDFGWNEDTRVLCILFDRKEIATGEERGL